MSKRLLKIGGYPRISEDPNDTRAGVDRQIEDIITEAVKLGADPSAIEWYNENDTSAYKKKRIKVVDPLGNEYVGYRVIRPQWHQALHDLRTKKIDVLIVWDLDRLARDPRDLEDAIEAAEYYGATIVSATASEIDLTTSSGQMTARFFVLIANKSSADTARRVARAHLATAKAGKAVGGYRPFGWKKDREALDPKESAAVLKAVDSLLAGRSLRSVTRELNEAGFTTTAGKPWMPATLRQYLKNPRLVGLRTYRRDVLLDESGAPVRGQWEPMLDRATYDRLQLLLDKPDERRRVPSRDSKHYLLTGILRCGVCGGMMYGNAAPKGAGLFYYKCAGERPRRHVVSGSGQEIDRLVTRLLLEYLATQDLGDVPTATEWPGESELTEAQQMADELMNAYMAKRISGERVLGRVEALEVKIADMKKDRAQWLTDTTGPVVAELTPEKFEALDTDAKRAHIGKVFEAVMVRPATQRGNRFDPSRLDPVQRQPSRRRPLRAVPS